MSTTCLPTCLCGVVLVLSGEIETLMTSADTNGDDRVDYQEFVKFAYDTLLQLGREKYLRALQKAAENRKVRPSVHAQSTGPISSFRISCSATTPPGPAADSEVAMSAYTVEPPKRISWSCFISPDRARRCLLVGGCRTTRRRRARAAWWSRRASP